jgi:hypothetical protein
MATISNPAPRIRLTLRMIATVDFRLGVPTHYDALKRKKLLRDIEEHETVLLVSQTGRQLAFVFSEVKIESRSGDPVTVIAHYRVQLDRHTPFNGTMLSEYAAKAGIDLVGIKRFEDHLAEAAA